MWTGVSRLAIGVTLVGALAAVLYYLGQSQAVPPIGPQVNALVSLDLLCLVVYLALFLALALVILRQQAVERRLPRYEALTEVQEARLRARDEEIVRLTEVQEERLRARDEEIARLLKGAPSRERGRTETRGGDADGLPEIRGRRAQSRVPRAAVRRQCFASHLIVPFFDYAQIVSYHPSPTY
jgi:hypothetical protein